MTYTYYINIWRCTWNDNRGFKNINLGMAHVVQCNLCRVLVQLSKENYRFLNMCKFQQYMWYLWHDLLNGPKASGFTLSVYVSTCIDSCQAVGHWVWQINHAINHSVQRWAKATNQIFNLTKWSVYWPMFTYIYEKKITLRNPYCVYRVTEDTVQHYEF